MAGLPIFVSGSVLTGLLAAGHFEAPRGARARLGDAGVSQLALLVSALGGQSDASLQEQRLLGPQDLGLARDPPARTTRADTAAPAPGGATFGSRPLSLLSMGGNCS